MPKVTYDEIKNCLVDENGNEKEFFFIDYGTEIIYKNNIVKVKGDRTNNSIQFLELMSKIYKSSTSINMDVRKKKLKIDIDSYFANHTLIKNGHANVEVINGIYGLRLNNTIKDKIKDLYLAWVELNNKRKQCSKTGRITNFPEEISENICCLELNKLLFLKKIGRDVRITFDCLDEDCTYQVKGSCSSGPTSFSPNDNYDYVYYFKVDINTSEYKIYEISKTDIDNIQIKKDMSLKQQRALGVRPRTNLDIFIESNKVTPIKTGYILDQIIKEEVK